MEIKNQAFDGGNRMDRSWFAVSTRCLPLKLLRLQTLGLSVVGRLKYFKFSVKHFHPFQLKFLLWTLEISQLLLRKQTIELLPSLWTNSFEQPAHWFLEEKFVTSSQLFPLSKIILCIEGGNDKLVGILSISLTFFEK